MDGVLLDVTMPCGRQPSTNGAGALDVTVPCGHQLTAHTAPQQAAPAAATATAPVATSTAVAAPTLALPLAMTVAPSRRLQLAPGWCEEWSKTHQRPYYYHEETRRVSWSPPVVSAACSENPKHAAEVCQAGVQDARGSRGFSPVIRRAASSDSVGNSGGLLSAPPTAQFGSLRPTTAGSKGGRVADVAGVAVQTARSVQAPTGVSSSHADFTRADSATNDIRAHMLLLARQERTRRLSSMPALTMLSGGHCPLSEDWRRNATTQTAPVRLTKAGVEDFLAQTQAIEAIQVMSEQQQRGRSALLRLSELEAAAAEARKERSEAAARASSAFEQLAAVQNQVSCLEAELSARSVALALCRHGLSAREGELDRVLKEVQERQARARCALGDQGDSPTQTLVNVRPQDLERELRELEKQLESRDQQIARLLSELRLAKLKDSSSFSVVPSRQSSTASASSCAGTSFGHDIRRLGLERQVVGKLSQTC